MSASTLIGKYATPKYRISQRINCMVRGEVIVAALSDGRIQWPLARKPGSGSRSFAVYGDLARAVRHESNQAVCHWWGVTPQTVTKWRKALGVERNNEGSHARRVDFVTNSPGLKLARLKAWSKARDPERCAKIAASKIGKNAIRTARRAKVTSTRLCSAPRRRARGSHPSRDQAEPHQRRTAQQQAAGGVHPVEAMRHHVQSSTG